MKHSATHYGIALAAKIASGLLVFSLLGLVACGGGKKNDLANEGDQDVSIDQLLGVEDSTAKAPEKTPEEDEVLRLLGIAKDEPKAQQNEAANPDLEALRSEVNRLENELMEKEKTISDLRNDLQQKDKQIESLQVAKTPSRSAAAARTLSSGAGTSYLERYRSALALYNTRKYREAIEAFSRLLQENSTNSYADNCQYWIGESYYGLGNFAQAIAEFEKVFAYPNSNKSDAALLKLGITYLKLGDRASARTQFEQLVANYPKSEYIDRARGYLGRL